MTRPRVTGVMTAVSTWPGKCMRKNIASGNATAQAAPSPYCRQPRLDGSPHRIAFARPGADIPHNHAKQASPKRRHQSSEPCRSGVALESARPSYKTHREHRKGELSPDISSAMFIDSHDRHPDPTIVIVESCRGPIVSSGVNFTLTQ